MNEVSYFGLYNLTKRLKDLILSSYVIPFLILYIQYRFGFYLDGSTYNFINIVPIIFTILNFSIVLIILALYYYKYNYKNIRNRILSDEFVLIKDRGFFIFHKDISVLLLFLPLLLMFPGWFFHIDMAFFLPITFMSFFLILFIYALFQKRKIKNDILRIYKKRSKSYYKLVKKNIFLFFEFKTKYNSYSDKTKINLLLNLIIAPSLLYFGNILFYISAAVIFGPLPQNGIFTIYITLLIVYAIISIIFITIGVIYIFKYKENEEIKNFVLNLIKEIDKVK